MQRMSRRAGFFVMLLAGLAVIAPSFLSGTSTMGGYGGYGGMMGGYGTLGTTGTVLGLVSQLGVLVLLVGGGYLLYQALRDTDEAHVFGQSDTALEELRLAYARGDLSEEEFELRRQRLQQGGDR